MKIKLRRAPGGEQAAHQEDTTTEFETGSRRWAHRRTTVIVERETVSFLIRRPAAANVAQTADAQGAWEPLGENLPAASPQRRNELSGGEP